jgi:hypothetical protein
MTTVRHPLKLRLVVSANNQRLEIGCRQKLKLATRSRAFAKVVISRRTSSRSRHDLSLNRFAIERPLERSVMTKANLGSRIKANCWTSGAKFHRHAGMPRTRVGLLRFDPTQGHVPQSYPGRPFPRFCTGLPRPFAQGIAWSFCRRDLTENRSHPFQNSAP